MMGPTLHLQKPGGSPESDHVDIAAIDSTGEWTPTEEDGLDYTNGEPIIFANVSLIDSQLADRVSVWSRSPTGPRERLRSLSLAGKSYDVWTGDLRFEPSTLTVTADRSKW